MLILPGSRAFSDFNKNKLLKSLQNSIQKESFDCVITSPPYASALPYVDTDRLSILLLCSMLSSDRKKIGMDKVRPGLSYMIQKIES